MEACVGEEVLVDMKTVDSNCGPIHNSEIPGSDICSEIHNLQIIKDCDDFVLRNQKLLDDFPELTALFKRLRKYILKQQNKIIKFASKINEKSKTNYKDACTQTESTESLSSGDSLCKTLVEEVKEAAENALQQTGFVYEETSGLYYDYNTGYYYNAELGLYYDGNTGSYYTYDQKSNAFQFHSYVSMPYTSYGSCDASDNTSNVQVKEKRKNEYEERGGKKIKIVDPEDGISDDESLEDGECSLSSEEDSEENNRVVTSPGLDDETDESAHAWPPCIRMIVTETKLEKLKVGTLFLVTYTGGTLGREGDHAVCIPDINISKHHAKFSFDESSGKYTIIDLGSRNGTYLDSKRLSVAKQESDTHEITHGSVLQLGCTKLLCHIHMGHETCVQCEPGIVQAMTETGNASPMVNSKSDRIKELKRLKKKFGVDTSEPDVSDITKLGYEDKAQLRRDTVGSQNHHEKTQTASVHESIQPENKGFKMLSKMGWSQGQALGKSGEGSTEPEGFQDQETREDSELLVDKERR